MLPPIPAILPYSHHEKEIPLYVTVQVLDQALQFKQQYPCFFIRNDALFSVSQGEKSDMFAPASPWVPGKVREASLAMMSPVLKTIEN